MTEVQDTSASDQVRPDLVIVGDDGSRVVVEVKLLGKKKTAYGAPKKTLDVVFTESGIEYLGSDPRRSEPQGDRPEPEDARSVSATARKQPRTQQRARKSRLLTKVAGRTRGRL